MNPGKNYELLDKDSKESADLDEIVVIPNDHILVSPNNPASDTVSFVKVDGNEVTR